MLGGVVRDLPIGVTALAEMRAAQLGVNDALGRLGRTDEAGVAEALLEELLHALPAAHAAQGASGPERERAADEGFQFHRRSEGQRIAHRAIGAQPGAHLEERFTVIHRFGFTFGGR